SSVTTLVHLIATHPTCLPAPPPRSPLLPFTTLFRSKSPASACCCPYLTQSARAIWRPSAKGSATLGMWRARVLPWSIALRMERRSEEHTSELQSPYEIVCRLLCDRKKRVTVRVYARR